MADFSIVFSAGALALSYARRPQLVKLDTLDVDCTLSESISYEAEVTEFEVERGADINDHRRTKPAEISIAGVVSDTPIDKSLIREAVLLAAGRLGLVLSTAETIQNLLAGDALFTRDAFEKLISLYERGAVTPGDGTFTIVTKYRTYERMTIKSLRFQRDGQTGFVLPFSATFKEMRVVDTSTALLQTPALLQSPASLGSASTDDATPALKTKGKSLLLNGMNAIGVDPLNSPEYQDWLKRQAVGK